MNKPKYKVGLLVSQRLWQKPAFGEYMPGVGEIIAIDRAITGALYYRCEFNGKIFNFLEDEIYEYEPY